MAETTTPTPDDVYAVETIAQFRTAGYWRDDDLWSTVAARAATDPAAVVVTDGTVTLRAGDVIEQAGRFAAQLATRGVRTGDRVLVQMPNWSEFVVVYLAVVRLGAVLVPTMPIYRDDEVGYVLAHSRAKVAVVAGEFKGFDYVDMLERVRGQAPDLAEVVTVRSSGRAGALRLEDLTAELADTSGLGPTVSADAPHCIIYTSGTESRPKGCLHTLNTIAFTVHSLGAGVLGMGPGETMFMPSPVTHATGLAMGVTAPLLLGCGIHLMDVWEPAAALERIADFGITLSMTATPFLQMLLDAMAERPESAERMKTMKRWVCAGAPIPPAMLERWSSMVPGCSLLPVYGRSEGLLVTACSDGDSREDILGSDGRPFPGVVLEIRDEEGNVVAPGVEGEICHGGPGLMLGYWQDPERTAESIDARGVSRSGDLGRMNEGGYLRVTGRIKDLIIRGGTNISAAEVENHILTHPKVAAVAVVAAPDERLGEIACAFVIPRDEAPTLAELTTHLVEERRIAKQKLPEMLEIVDTLPVTTTGKVQKFVLRERARELVTKART